jgi:ABC-2 type transport system ATP-binding protein
MDYGKVIVRGSPQQLLDQHLPNKRVCLNKPDGRVNFLNLSGDIEEKQNELHIITGSIEQTIQELLSQSVDLSTLRVRNPTLEDLFIKLTGHELRD